MAGAPRIASIGPAMPHQDTSPAPRCAISWSAGKDSWLALMRAREQGLAVATFVTMCDADGTSKSHALPPSLIAAQVHALGGTPVSVRVPPGEYAARFDACLRELAAGGHTHMIFGDIDLQAHRDWLAPACERAGLVPLFPLWGESRAELARELVTRGVQARVVCVDTRWLDAPLVLRRELRRGVPRAPARERLPVWRGRRVPHLRQRRAGLRDAHAGGRRPATPSRVAAPVHAHRIRVPGLGARTRNTPRALSRARPRATGVAAHRPTLATAAPPPACPCPVIHAHQLLVLVAPLSSPLRRS